MKATLIDPETKTITSVDIGTGIRAIYEQLNCNTFAIIPLDANGEAMYVDDEGLMDAITEEDAEGVGGKGTQFFVLTDAAGSPINLVAERGLILGCDAEGNSTDTSISPEAISPRIRWVKDQAAAVDLAASICDQTCVISSQEELDRVRQEYSLLMEHALASCE